MGGDLVSELIVATFFLLLPFSTHKLYAILLSPSTHATATILTHLIHANPQVALSMRFRTVHAIAATPSFLVHSVWAQLCLVLGRVVDDLFGTVCKAAVYALWTECVGVVGRGG